MNSGNGVAREQFETRLEQELFFERITNLNRWTIFFGFLRQLARCERRARQTVASSFGADIKNWIANAACSAARKLFVAQHAETENVHQWISLETFVEINFAADGRDSDAISVMRNARNDACEKTPISGDCGLAIADCGKIL